MTIKIGMIYLVFIKRKYRIRIRYCCKMNILAIDLVTNF